LNAKQIILLPLKGGAFAADRNGCQCDPSLASERQSLFGGGILF